MYCDVDFTNRKIQKKKLLKNNSIKKSQKLQSKKFTQKYKIRKLMYAININTIVL